MDPVSFCPSAKQNAMVAALVAAGGAVVVFGVLLFSEGRENWAGIAGFSVFAGLCFGVYYQMRFLSKAPRAVRFEPGQITVEPRKGPAETLSWKHVTSVLQGNDKGIFWAFQHGSGELRVRDDGFSMDQWDDMCKRIREECAKAGVECKTEGAAVLSDALTPD